VAKDVASRAYEGAVLRVTNCTAALPYVGFANR